MKILTITIVLLALALGGCAANASPAPGAIYDDECRVRTYSEGWSHEEKKDWADEYAERMTGGDHRIDPKDPSNQEVMEDMGVPYYEMCMVSGGE